MTTWQDSMHDEKPRWLKMLFHLFVVNYKNLWTDSLQHEALEKAQEFLWSSSLRGVPEEIVMEAGLKAIQTYSFPPSIQQFLEITSAMQRNKRMDNTAQKVLTSDQKYSRGPVSPLLAEYMEKNPRQAEDPFKALFAKYSGQELGTEVLKEIKKQLGSKHVA